MCVVRAGREQFLIGVTASQISLLGRLGHVVEAAEVPVPAPVEAAEPRANVDEPTATDFARGLGERRAARSSPRAALRLNRPNRVRTKRRSICSWRARAIA